MTQLINAADLLQQAQTKHRNNDLDGAEKIYNKLLSKNMENHWLLYLLGTIQLQKGYTGLAANIFKQALTIDKDHGPSLCNLGYAYKAENRSEDAEKAWLAATKLMPDDPDLWANLSAVHCDTGITDQSLKYVEKALTLDPKNKTALWNKGLCLLQDRDWSGWELYEHRALKQRSYSRTLPKWQGEKGKVLVIHGEQGLGDEIMFASCLKEAIRDSKKVLVECEPRLRNLFARSFPEAIVIGTHDVTGKEWPSDFKPDCWIAIGSLPGIYRKDGVFPGKPYLLASNEKRKFWRGQLSNRPKIGLSWQGGVNHTRVEDRSISPERLKPLLELDADFVSLQYTPGARDDALKLGIKHWPAAAEPTDYDETAALVSELDLVITVCCSVVHLCGALGVPCWTLVPSRPSWRYGTEGDLPWYKSVKLYRHKTNWDDLIQEVTTDAHKRFLQAA